MGVSSIQPKSRYLRMSLASSLRLKNMHAMQPTATTKRTIKKRGRTPEKMPTEWDVESADNRAVIDRERG